jgi:hypothetical protein
VFVPFVYDRDVSELDLHWLAGLLEGEGSFVPGPPSAPRMPAISMQTVDEDVVARAAALLGRKFTRIRPRQAHWQVSFMLRATGGRAVAWMKILHPLLGRRRQAQVDRALACYDPRDPALLSEAQAGEALRALAAGATVKAVAERFGTSIWCIYDLRLGRTHRHVPRPPGLRRAS